MALFAASAFGQNFVTGADTGSENKLDNTPTNATFTMNVSGVGTYSFAGGIFFMKAGSQTTGSVTFTVFDSGNTALGSVTLSNSSFCAGFSNCQSYAYHTFQLASPLNLANGTYTLVLSTTASPAQNQAYFIKGAGATFNVGNPPPADLTVTKSVNPDPLTQGLTGAYSIQVTNIGSVATSGTITVTDTLGANLSYTSATGTGWTCGNVAQVVTCTTSAAIAPGGSAPAISVSVSVATNGQTTVTNDVAVALAGETNTTNNSFQLVTNVLPPQVVDLTITKIAIPATFVAGQSGQYSLLVANGGNIPSTGTITVTDTLDANLTFVSASGTGWTCNAALQVVTCTSSTAIAAGGTGNTITINVSVKTNNQSSVTNNAAVSGGGQTNTSNDTFQLVTNVTSTIDLTITKSAAPTTFIAGQAGAYTLTVNNIGNTPTTGTITVTDTLDANLTFVSATGTGWTCGAAAQVVTCTSSAAIAPAGTGTAITINVTVKTNNQTSVTNNAAVSGGGQGNTTNDTFQLVTNVNSVIDLTVTKIAVPSTFTAGQQGAMYSLTVNNIGNTPTTGTITVTDTLGANLTYVSAAGTGWTCNAAAQVVTCTSTASIPAGGSGANIGITVNVASNNQSSVTNNVAATGGGQTNTANDTFQLVTNVNAAPPRGPIGTPTLSEWGMILLTMLMAGFGYLTLRRRTA